MSQTLIVLDIPGIKSYVFASNSLREIQGASALIDHFSRWETESLLRNWFHRNRPAHAPTVSVKKVFANAGGGQFLAQAEGSPDENETKVRQAVLHLAQELHGRSCGGLALSFGIAPVPEGPDGYRRALDLAHKRMRHRRKNAPKSGALATWPLARECESLALEPAGVSVNIGGDVVPETDPRGRWLSHVTLQKLEAALWARGRIGAENRGSGRAHGLWKEFEEQVGRPPAYNLDALGSEAKRAGYIGLLYADGNSMGQVVRKIPDPDSYRAFSEIVDGSIRKSTYGLVRELELEAFPLLLGGDDLVMVVAADRALQFAARLPEEFQRCSREAINSSAAPRWLRERCPHGFSLSIGIAFGRARHPFHLLLHQAEQLLQSAKRDALGEKDPTGKARIDFHLTHSSSTREIGPLRKEEWELWEKIGHRDGRSITCRRTFRPYRPHELTALLECVSQLRGAGMPRNKVSTLGEAAWSDSLLEAEILALETIGRMKPGQRQALAFLEKKLHCSGTPPFYTIPDSTTRRAFAIDLQECFSLGSSNELSGSSNERPWAAPTESPSVATCQPWKQENHHA